VCNALATAVWQITALASELLLPTKSRIAIYLRKEKEKNVENSALA
jgi:hypothetical protein